jgi:hypothetical protein
LLLSISSFFQRNPGAAGEKLQRLGKIDALELLNKLDDVAVFITGPTAVALAARIDVKGGAAVVVEGAEALEGLAGRPEGDVAADDVHDVVGFLDLLDQDYPIVWQGLTGARRTSKKASHE